MADRTSSAVSASSNEPAHQLSSIVPVSGALLQSHTPPEVPSEKALMVLNRRLLRVSSPQARAEQMLRQRHLVHLQQQQSVDPASTAVATGRVPLPSPPAGRAPSGNCFRCNLPGHWAANCPNGSRQQRQAPTSQAPEMRLSDLSPSGRPMLISSTGVQQGSEDGNPPSTEG